MSTIINTRSPYFITQGSDSGTQVLVEATLELYIYSGVLGGASKPSTPTYSIAKASIGSSSDSYVAFEVSELIRDYIYTDYYEQSIDAVWVETEIFYSHTDGTTGITSADYLAIDGFGYFEDGVNPRTSTDPTQSSFTPMVLQDNTTVYFIQGEDIRIPVFSETEPTVTTDIGNGKWDGNDNFWETVNVAWQNVDNDLSISDSNNSADKIQYVIITSEGAVTGDTITFTSTVGSPQTTVITLRDVCEPKYNPYRIVYYNKYGALQDIWASKKSVITTRTKSTQFNLSTIDFSSGAPQYSITKNSKQRFNIAANQTISVNTPFFTEDMNEPIEQMMMSQNAWIEDNSGSEQETLPIIIKTQEQKRKTSVNDKLIQYSFEFDYAFDKINNIR